MEAIEKGGVTSPKGYKAAGIHAGLKKKKKDLALLVSDTPAVAAGVFTRNVVAAAPVLYCKEVLKAPHVRGLVVNSGNANACTGDQGLENARAMGAAAAAAVGAEPEEMLVSSTGVIGYQLPMEKIRAGISQAAEHLSAGHGHDAAKAIMTTDTFSKEIAVRFPLGEATVTVGGMSKGSGMIHPNMATMLCFVTTDCAIGKECLQGMVSDITDRTFNMITVDGDTSTNDMLLVLANGQAENPEITGPADEGYAAFYDALYLVCRHLAIEIARDGEGATKLVTVQVSGAASLADARIAAKSVCSSNLVKTAVFGEDANWGRILAAVGYSGISFDPYGVDIAISSAAGSIQVALKGTGIGFSEEEALKILKEKEITFEIRLSEGSASATAWCCDFSYDYVKINASYRS